MNRLEFIEEWVNILGLDHQNHAKIEQFDDRKFKFSMYLLNQDGNAIKLRKGSISELFIEDNILDWFHKGHVTVMNPDDIIERAESIYMGDGNTLAEQNIRVTPYKFRGDGRDLVFMTFEPHLSPAEDGQAIDSTLNSYTFTMKFLFTVYATEDITDPGGKRDKKQKMYFHDYRYQLLREKNLYYSTCKVPDSSGIYTSKTLPICHLGDEHKKKPTGEIIQDILRTSLPSHDTTNKFSYHWDFGGSKMMYTSPADYKALDDLNYVMDRHVSTGDYEYQPCIFRLERFTERWELLPVTELFARSKSGADTPGVLQTEHFLLSNDSEPDKIKIPPERKTFGRDVKTLGINYHFPDISLIDDYTFSEINGVDCQEMLNSVIIHRYDKRSKQFKTDVASSNISTVHEKFQQLFIDHTFGGVGGHGVTGWLPDSSRAKNFNFDVKSGWGRNMFDSYPVSRNKLLLGAFLLGNTIQFESRGETSRRAGVWIAIDRDTNYVDNAYEMKVLGQYFVTRVTHKISASGEYSNNIMAVKPYFYQDLDFDTKDFFDINTNITPKN